MPLKNMPVLSDALWLMRKELVTVGARPSQGKSSLMGSWGFDFSAQGIPTLLVTLETDVEAYLERGFAYYSRIDNRSLLKGGFKNYRHQYNEYSDFISKAPLIITSLGRSWKEFKKTYDRFEPKPRAVMIDYMQCISGSSSDNRRETIDEYLYNLRSLAIKDDFLAVVCSQISRASNTDANKAPGMQHLKESGKFEELSDKVLLLHYPYVYDEAKSRNEYILIKAKDRNGPTGRVPLSFEPQYYRFSDGSIPEVKKTEEVRKYEAMFNGRAVEEW